ncbi:MAG: hypothetical protein Q9162_006254 [Coniocarpon cinnabarinum]
MTDLSPSPDANTESKAQRDARLRRERRNAKIQGEGSSRLSKITSMSGRPAAAEAELTRAPSPKPASSNPQHGSTRKQGDGQADDPAEVDISSMFQRPLQNEAMDQQEMFRRMLRAGADDDPGAQGQEEDPMMKMMQQMMGTFGADGQQSAGMPPNLTNMFGGGQDQEQPQVSSGDYIWRIVHALFSLLLGIYTVTTLAFTGSSLSRSQYATDPIGPRLFWMFATAELVLQTTRYFVDRGKLPPSSFLGKIAAFLPEPYAGYLRLLNRYSIIYTTVVSDALVVVFVLGCFAWWKGLADA